MRTESLFYTMNWEAKTLNMTSSQEEWLFYRRKHDAVIVFGGKRCIDQLTVVITSSLNDRQNYYSNRIETYPSM